MDSGAACPKLVAIVGERMVLFPVYFEMTRIGQWTVVFGRLR
jgi:hypothetical protein